MTSLLLLLLGAALLFSGALWLLLFREALVASWWYRLFQDPDGFGSGLVRGLRRDECPWVPDPYPPEAAEAPTYERARLLDEVGPCIVAGSDLDRPKRPMAEVNLRLRLMIDADAELADLRKRSADLAPLYVVPEVER